MIDVDLLKTEAEKQNLDLSREMLEMFDLYAARLVETNRVMNLTAITEPKDIVYKHFLDSLSAAPFLPEGPFSLIDVGTGAGFPGIPLQILRFDMKLTLLDSLQKRLTFLEGLCRELGFSVQTVHMRAEEAGQDPAFRERFDIVTARAVAGLSVLSEWCLPLAKVGGRFIPLKGSAAMQELKDAENALKTLGGTYTDNLKFEIPAENTETERHFVLHIAKTSKTPRLYPRPNGQIKKKPL